MTFSNEVGLMLGNELMRGYKVTIYPNLTIVEGHRGLAQYSAESIKLRLDGKRCLVVTGQNFVIKNSSKDEIMFSGNIACVEVQQ